VYQPKQLAEAPGSTAADLAAHAWNRRLTLYAGAGLSAAPPTSLPGAARLARLVANALEGQIPLDGVKCDDLIAVADTVAAHPHGADLLRRTILGVADLLGAPINYAHEVLGLLLCEGVATIFETNYDDCIERGAQPERPTVVLTATELLDSTGRALLKVHGCATQPRTMLVTQADLDDAPRWAQTRVAAQLGTDRMAFIGIGSPADYVRQNIIAVLEDVGVGHLVLVDPLLATWDDDPPSEWRELLPDLEEEQRDPRSAEEFCDALLRAYLHHPRLKARQAVGGMPAEHPQRVGVESFVGAIERRDAVWILRWLRGASFKLATGEPVAVSAQAVTGFLSVGALVGDAEPQCLAPQGWLFVSVPSPELGGSSPASKEVEPIESPAAPELISEQPPPATTADLELAEPVPVMLLLVHGVTFGALAEDEARQRVIRARQDGVVQAGELVVVVAVRHVGRMTTEVSVAPGDRLADVLSRVREQSQDSSPENLVADISPRHVIDGPRTGPVVILNGEHLIDAA
jgi:hypothetical protein